MEVCRKEFAKILYKLAEELVEEDIGVIDSDDDDEVFYFEEKIEKLCQSVLDELIAVKTISGKEVLTMRNDEPFFVSDVSRELWF